MNLLDVPRVAIQSSRGFLMMTIPSELSGPMLQQFQSDLFAAIERSGVRGMVVDLSGVAIADLHDFAQLMHILQVAKAMGVLSVLSGLQPGLVSYLVDSPLDLSGLHTSLHFDAALQRLEQLVAERERRGVALALGDDNGEMGL